MALNQNLSRRAFLAAGAAVAVSAALPPTGVLAEGGMSEGFVALRAQLAANSEAYERAQRAHDIAFPAIERQARLLSDGDFEVFWERWMSHPVMKAPDEHHRAAQNTVCAIFTRTPENVADEYAIMDAIEIYEKSWSHGGVLRDAPRAFFTPARFLTPEEADRLASDRDHFLDIYNNFEKFRRLPDFLIEMRAQKAAHEERSLGKQA